MTKQQQWQRQFGLPTRTGECPHDVFSWRTQQQWGLRWLAFSLKLSRVLAVTSPTAPVLGVTCLAAPLSRTRVAAGALRMLIGSDSPRRQLPAQGLPSRHFSLPFLLQIELCRWRDRYRSNKLGDRKAKTSRTKWHSEPHGFEIIGGVRERERGEREKKKEAYFSYTDALRTIHLTRCEPITVSSCLADNMAKGIHLNRPKRQQREN